MNAYEASLKQNRDWNSALAYAVEEALAKGEEKGRAEGLEQGLEKGREEGLEKGHELGPETAKRAIALKKQGYSNAEIAKLTNLSEDDVNILFE
jgi:flagellar biosynthesis/type III secretory pathway protein FliH